MAMTFLGLLLSLENFFTYLMVNDCFQRQACEQSIKFSPVDLGNQHLQIGREDGAREMTLPNIATHFVI